MKTPLKLLLLLLTIVLIAPAVTPTHSPAQTEKEIKSPPPTGVSPANPDIDPPAIDPWRCPNCGAECPHMGKKARFNRPMLGSRDRGAPDVPGRRHGFDHHGRDRGTCDMPGGRHACHRSRRGRHGDGPGMHGDRNGNAAMRMVMRAEQLDLTKEQVAKLEKLAYDTKTKVIDLRAALEKTKLELRQLERTDSDNLTAMKRHLKSIADIRVEMRMAKIANRIDAKNILTDEQKEMVKKRSPNMGRKFNCR